MDTGIQVDLAKEVPHFHGLRLLMRIGQAGTDHDLDRIEKGL